MRLDTNRTTHRAILVCEEKEPIKLTALGFSAEFYAASQFEVEAEFSFSAGYPPILTGPMEDSDPGAPPEIVIKHLRVVKDVQFDSEDEVPVARSILAPDDLALVAPGLSIIVRRGRDIRDLFSTREISLFEDELLARALSKDTDD